MWLTDIQRKQVEGIRELASNLVILEDPLPRPYPFALVRKSYRELRTLCASLLASPRKLHSGYGEAWECFRLQDKGIQSVKVEFRIGLLLAFGLLDPGNISARQCAGICLKLAVQEKLREMDVDELALLGIYSPLDRHRLPEKEVEYQRRRND